jgi:hypothetical protein
MTPDVRQLETNSTIGYVYDPNIVLAEAAFNARDYVITRDRIRTSFDFQDIYQKYYIDKLHPTRFSFLNNIKNFNFDYNYQIGSLPTDLCNLLKPDGSNIPTYLAGMQDYWEKSDDTRKKAC